MSTAAYVAGADVLDRWRQDLLIGATPVLYPCGVGDFARIELGPGRVVLVGGAPGSGKTALTTQAAVDALRLSPDLRAVLCNVEMAPAALLDRQLARLSGVALDVIRRRQLAAEHADRIDAGLATLEPLADRLCFVQAPFDLANVAAAADDFGGGLIVLDYIQRIRPPGEHGDRRGSVDATMSHLRAFAAAGVAVLVVSAVGRGKDARGRSSYGADALSLASFRESSELEFGADDAFLLTEEKGGAVTLRHLKSRYGERQDIALQFDGAHQRFESVNPTPAAAGGKLSAAVAALWAITPAAAADDDGDDE